MAHPAPSHPHTASREVTSNQRRQEILAKAIDLFATHGYAGTDTQLLADALKVGKGTLYRYFPSKQELFLAAVDTIVRQMHERIEAGQAGVVDPLEQIRQVILAYLTFFAEHPEFVELLIQERALFKDRGQSTYFQQRQRNIERWRDVYRRLMSEGRVRPMPPERITTVISDLVYGTMFSNYFANCAPNPAAQVEAILDVVWNGILSDRQRQQQLSRQVS
jgi:AcrR family transcriptional regulator